MKTLKHYFFIGIAAMLVYVMENNCFAQGINYKLDGNNNGTAISVIGFKNAADFKIITNDTVRMTIGKFGGSNFKGLMEGDSIKISRILGINNIITFGDKSIQMNTSTNEIYTDNISPALPLFLQSSTFNNHTIINANNTGNIGIGTTSPLAKLSVGANSEFQVTSLGNITKINNISYSFPSVQGDANTILQNDGLGNLSWQPASGGGVTSTCTTANFLPKVAATGSPNLSCSQIFDNGINVGIGISSSLGARLHVKGAGFTFATFALKINNSFGNLLFSVHNSGHIEAGDQHNNLFFGTSAGFNIGDNNTANGVQALFSNTTGSDNTANGFRSLFSNTTGGGNTATGADALFSNTTGTANSAYGGGALSTNTTGDENTATGLFALYSNTTGVRNTATGYSAGSSYSDGNYNTFLGYFTDVGASTLSNCVAIGGIGNLAITASNTVRIGSATMASIGGQVGWTTVSDARTKTDVQENVSGLAFIKELRPVTYIYDINKENELMGIKDTSDYLSKYDIEKTRFSGFLAQEVDAAAKKLGYEFSGVDKTNSLWGLRYAEFTVPLVKAVQEQQDIIKEQQKQIDELKKLVLGSDNHSSKGNFTTGAKNNKDVMLNSGVIILDQNNPNPFKEQTTISYFIPKDANSVMVIFTDMKGDVIKEVPITEKGKGQLNVYASDLLSGIYIYSIVADGVTLDTKKMLKSK